MRGEMKPKNACVLSLPPVQEPMPCRFQFLFFRAFFRATPWLTERVEEAITLANQKELRKSHQLISQNSSNCM